MKQQENLAFMAMIAELYYINGKSQKEIAKLTGISQTKASRLITKAREIGMVQVTVNKHEPRNEELEQKLIKKYKLNTVVSIKTWKKQDQEYHYKNIAFFAAPVLTEIILQSNVVCLSTSRHISYLVCEIMQQEIKPSKHKMSIIQTQGGLGMTLTSHDSIDIGLKLASFFGASFHPLQAPAVTSCKEERDSFMNHMQIKCVLSMMDRADSAIVGVGTVEDSVFIANDSFKHQSPADLIAKGAVGEVCGRFFDADGKECDTKYKNCVLGMSLEQLKRTPEVVAVSSGLSRVPAIASLIKNGYVKSIITDQETAEGLLEF